MSKLYTDGELKVALEIALLTSNACSKVDDWSMDHCFDWIADAASVFERDFRDKYPDGGSDYFIEDLGAYCEALEKCILEAGRAHSDGSLMVDIPKPVITVDGPTTIFAITTKSRPDILVAWGYHTEKEAINMLMESDLDVAICELLCYIGTVDGSETLVSGKSRVEFQSLTRSSADKGFIARPNYVCDECGAAFMKSHSTGCKGTGKVRRILIPVHSDNLKGITA